MMRKYLVAASIGAMLIAGQAAASDSAVVNLGDRIGTPSDSGSQIQGISQSELLLLLLGGGAFIALIVWGFSQNNHHPASP
jgi:hypothetical protein